MYKNITYKVVISGILRVRRRHYRIELEMETALWFLFQLALLLLQGTAAVTRSDTIHPIKHHVAITAFPTLLGLAKVATVANKIR